MLRRSRHSTWLSAGDFVETTDLSDHLAAHLTAQLTPTVRRLNRPRRKGSSLRLPRSLLEILVPSFPHRAGTIKKMKSQASGQLIREEDQQLTSIRRHSHHGGPDFIPAAILVTSTLAVSALFFGTTLARPLPWLTIAFTWVCLAAQRTTRNSKAMKARSRSRRPSVRAALPFAYLAFQFLNERRCRPASTAISFVRDPPTDLFAAA